MSYRLRTTVVLRILATVPLLMCPSLAAAQTSGLVAAYAFNETSGTTALDASGNGNNGVLTNGPLFVVGKNSNGVRLDGVNDYVNLSNPASLRLTGSMTLSAWINSSAFPVDDAAIISKRQSSETGYQLDTTIDRGPRTIGFKITNGSGNNVIRYGATAMQTNTWYHVAGVYDATNRTMAVYLNGQLDNGVLVGTIPAAQLNSNQNVNVGRRPGVPGTFNFAGMLDDVRIYNRALSQIEIQTDMNTPVGGTPPPPDTTPPTVAITAPTSGSTYTTNTSPLTLSGTAADNVGVTQVSWASDRGGSGTATGTTSWSVPSIPLQAGANVLTVTARDAAGNTGTATLTVTYDATPPTVSITAPGPGATVSGTTTITATTSDNIGVVGVQFLLDSAALGPEQTGPSFSLSWNTTAVSNGVHVLSARARDAANNTALAPNISVTVANTQTPGLVAAYGFNEGSGTTVLDISGNNNTGTISGATWTTLGKFGRALVFNGTSARVTINDSSSLRLTSGMTLEAWVNPSTVTSVWRDVIYKGNDNYFLEATSDLSGVPAGGGTFGGTDVVTYGTAALPVNTWTHLALTYDGATLRLYVNGAQVSSLARTGNLAASTNPLQIGGDSLFGQYFQGTIDEVRVYNRALAQAEIQTDMTTPVGGTPPPPDATPPTVAINAPHAGATVFGLVSVSVIVSDNVGIAGVQFLRDNNVPLGAEVTNAPYSILWDTTSVSPGSHSLTAVARDFAGNSTTSASVSVTVAAATASRVGQWSAPVTWPIVAVHASLLPTGAVLAWDGQTNGNDARLWNPTTGVFTSIRNNLTNMFCSGHCALADGQILVAGGHAGGHTGVTDTNLFDPVASKWTKVGAMSDRRWYPTTTTLSDGRVLVTAGETNCDRCEAEIPEIYNPQSNSWTQLSGARLNLPYYPHMFVLPDGRVLAAATGEDPIITYALNISTQAWSVIDPNPVDGGSSVMYLPGKVMKTGTSTDPDMPIFPSAATTYVLDMTEPSPAWRETAPMAFPRTYHTLTLLPDGTVLATGGGVTTDAVGVNTAVSHAELWSPVSETWTTMASMQKPRLYHSTALLLPDGRVLAAGGGRFNGVNEPTDQLSSETYAPPYLFDKNNDQPASRPAISSAPATASYGGTIAIQTPDAAQITAVSLIRLGSVTHAFNQNQRFLQLLFTTGSGVLNVQAPSSANLAPPGYYMLFILNANGVPSVAATLKLQ